MDRTTPLPPADGAYYDDATLAPIPNRVPDSFVIPTDGLAGAVNSLPFASVPASGVERAPSSSPVPFRHLNARERQKRANGEPLFPGFPSDLAAGDEPGSKGPTSPGTRVVMRFSDLLSEATELRIRAESEELPPQLLAKIRKHEKSARALLEAAFEDTLARGSRP